MFPGFIYLSSSVLTHCGLVTPYGDIDLVKIGWDDGLLPAGNKLNQFWLILGEVLQHSHGRTFSQEMKIPITDVRLKSCIQDDTPSRRNQLGCNLSQYYRWSITWLRWLSVYSITEPLYLLYRIVICSITNRLNIKHRSAHALHSMVILETMNKIISRITH